MTRRRRLRRRLLWAGVFLGLVLVLAVASTMRACLWCHDVVVGAVRPDRTGTRGRTNRQKGDSMSGKFSLAAVVTATALALAAPAVGAIPYLSHGQGVDESQFSGAAQATEQATVVPYLSQGQGVDMSQFGGTAPAEQPQVIPYASRGVGVDESRFSGAIREPVGDDHFRDPPDAALVAAAANGTETSWPQVGLGVGLVLVLALGMLITLRGTRTRPLPR
jgi:hypothetical protein